MTMRVWIHSSLMPDFDASALGELLPTFTPITPNIYEGVMSQTMDEGNMSLDLYELLIQDLDPLLLMLTLQEGITWLPDDFILDSMHDLKAGFYTLEHYLYQIVLKSEFYRNQIGKYLDALLDKEMIDTLVKYATHEMNASKASKALYIHRNTLQYRFTIFQEKTCLDPKSFETIALFHAIFAQQFMHSA